MSHRQVPIEWLDLEAAFETHADDSASFLDLRTGKVHFVPFDEEVLADAEEALSEEAADTGLAQGWLHSGRPPGIMRRICLDGPVRHLGERSPASRPP